MKLLFIIDKYWGGDPTKGPTNIISNLVNSFKPLKFGDPKIYYISSDPGDLDSTDKVDEILLLEDYDLALVSPVGTWWSGMFGQGDHITVSLEVAEKLKNKIAICWWDSVLHYQQSEIEEYAKHCPQLLFDWGYGEDRPNIFGVSTPQDPIFFNSTYTPKTIPTSFIGDPYRSGRQEILSQIPEVVVKGGRGNDNLSLEEYTSYFKQSKINLNFQTNIGIPQRKGRPFEIAACGGFMLSTNPEAFLGKDGLMFEPQKEFIILDPNNLNSQIDYWLKHDGHREEIAFNMSLKYNKLFAPEPWWNNIFKICKV
jgi:hypothetical protein